MRIIPLSVAVTGFAFAIYTIIHKKDYTKKEFKKKLTSEIIISTIFLILSFL